MPLVVFDHISLLDGLWIFHLSSSGQNSRFGDFWGCFSAMQSNWNSSGIMDFYLGNLVWDRILIQRPLKKGTCIFLQIYTRNLCLGLSPLSCNLAVCLLGSAGLSDPCVYKLTGYRYLGQIHCPEFSFLHTLALKYFPVAARVLVGRIGSPSLGPSPQVNEGSAWRRALDFGTICACPLLPCLVFLKHGWWFW